MRSSSVKTKPRRDGDVDSDIGSSAKSFSSMHSRSFSGELVAESRVFVVEGLDQRASPSMASELRLLFGELRSVLVLVLKRETELRLK